MTLLQKLSNLLGPLTSPHRRGNQQDLVPPSDASDPLQRTQLSNVSDDTPLGSSESVIQSQVENPTETPNAPRYAEGFRPTPESWTVRSLLRQTIPRPRLGMRRLAMENGPRRRDQETSRQDEDRLFPPSSARASPNGVPIVPGQTFKKKNPTQNLRGFKPVDKISSRGRESGPVRARGKQGSRGGLQTLSSIDVPRPETFPEHEFSERPAKRRRRDHQSPSAQKVVDISDDDITAPSVIDSSSIAGNNPRLSPSSSQQSGKPKRTREAKRNAVDEFRQVEKNVRVNRSQLSPTKFGAKRFHRRFSSDEEFEQHFTENAARQRRISGPGVKHEALQSVEIHKPRETGSPPLHILAINRNRRDSELRESPDELQGAVTVQPAPEFLSDVRKKDVRGGPDVGDQAETTQRVSSPADILPTVFVPLSRQGQGRSKRKNIKSKKRTTGNRCFQAKFVRFGNVIGPTSDHEAVDLDVDIASEVLKMSGAGLAVTTHQLPLQRVNKVFRGDSPNCKVRLCLSRTEGAGDHLVDVELTSSEAKDEFCSLFTMRHVTVVGKEGKWMDDAFKRSTNMMIASPRFTNGSKRPGTETVQATESKVEVSKRPKLSTSLEDDDVPLSRPGSRESPDNSEPSQKSHDASVNATARPASSKAGTEETEEIPVKKYTRKGDPPSRATRSMLRRMQPATVVSDDDDDDLPEPKCDKKTKRWQQSLVYPRFGKKKAEVDAQDLERLRENEFLNDNLIGFYIRFLEDHLERNNKEVSKRVYFFNSYFFATLTNLPRGRQGINYEGVQKWTRNVDIFSYDYIVVPINEAAHWYVAIICNLPQLSGIRENTGLDEPLEGYKEPSTLPNRDVREIPNTSETVGGSPSDNEEPEAAAYQESVPTKEESARESLALMSLFDQMEPHDSEPREVPLSDEEWPEKEENPLSSPAKFSSPKGKTRPLKQSDSQNAGQTSTTGSQKGRKPKKKRLGPRYDARQPMVITFDSLNLSRSPTISVLRNYLREEAKSKRGLEIDTTLIKGMKAQEIPLQPNYSDCGLYLLAYVEKFVQDPDTFVTKLLGKEMRSEDDWPPLRSGLLRHRLRKFLDDLYDEQEQLSREKANEKTTMADQLPISFLLGPLQHEAESGVEDTTVALPAQSETSPSREPALKTPDTEHAPEKHVVPETQLPAANSSKDDTRDGEMKRKKTRPEKSPTGSAERTARGEIIEVPDSQEHVDGSYAKSPDLIVNEEPRAGEARPKLQSPDPDNQDAVQVQISQYPGDNVEVQVLGTPPPRQSKAGEGVRKSPRSSKTKG